MSDVSDSNTEHSTSTLTQDSDASSKNCTIQKEVYNGGSECDFRNEDDMEVVDGDSVSKSFTHTKNGCSETKNQEINDSHSDSSKKTDLQNSAVNGHPSSPAARNLPTDITGSDETKSASVGERLNGSKHENHINDNNDRADSSISYIELSQQKEFVDANDRDTKNGDTSDSVDNNSHDAKNSEGIDSKAINGSSKELLDEKIENSCKHDLEQKSETIVKSESEDANELDLSKSKIERDASCVDLSCKQEKNDSVDSKTNPSEIKSNVDTIKEEKSDANVKDSAKTEVKKEAKVSELNGMSVRENKSDLSRVSDAHMKPSTSSSPSHKSSKSKPPPDNMRSVGRLLYDLGLDLVRQEVYKDLIDIQAAKDDEHKLDEKEKGQLVKLTEAHARLRSKNSTYCIPRIKCSSHCRYSSTSENVLQLHREHGHVSSSQPGVHVCCICEAFRTKFPSQFVTHMETVHKMNGKLTKKPVTTICSFCPYEHKNVTKVEAHAAKCAKKFQLASNLQPLPSDCDIPIKHRPVSNWSRPGTNMQYDTTNMNKMQGMNTTPGGSRDTRYSSPAGSQSNSMEIGGQMYSWSNQRGKSQPSYRSPMGSSASGSGMSTPSINMACSSSGVMRPMGMQQAQQRMNSPQNLTSRSSSSGAPSTSSPQKQPQQRRNEICEICGMNVENRQALWTHLHATHKLELSRVSMNEQEPCIVCDICKARFWTYQGLARHSLLLHKRNISSGGGSSGATTSGVNVAGARSTFRCHLCGASQTVNPLNHLSTHHNITLLDMYHGRQCCMCNRKLRNGRAFEEHMIKEHRDIFANQDVLRTVLQALSTALYLKSEDVHQRMPQPQGMQQQARQQQQQIQQAAAAAAAMAVRQRSYGPQNNMYSAGSSTSMQNMRARTPSSSYVSNDKRSRPRNPSSTPEPIVIPTKPTPDKKTTEEETKVLNKLYEDYADIGRPISRAMKHKLLLSPNSSAAGASVDKKSNGDALNLSVNAEKSPDAGSKSLASDRGSEGGESEEREKCAAEDVFDTSEAKKPRLDDDADNAAVVDDGSSTKTACSTVS